MPLKNAFFAALAFGIFMYAGATILHSPGFANVAAPVSAVLFGGILYFFANSKMVSQQTKMAEQTDSEVIYAGGANHFIHAEAVGGKLYLLKDRFEFVSHKFNIQNHATTIHFEDIDHVETYNSLGIIPNGIKIVRKNNSAEKFVVMGRSTWMEHINHQLN